MEKQYCGISEAEEETCLQLAFERIRQRQRIGSSRTAENFLQHGANLLAERGKQYDQPDGERSMGKTVRAFNVIAGRDLSEAEGWLFMSLLKRVRQYSQQEYHKDSAEDAVNYAALEAEALERADNG